MTEADHGRKMMQRHPQARFVFDLDAQGVVVEMQIAFRESDVKGVEQLHGAAFRTSLAFGVEQMRPAGRKHSFFVQ